MVLDKLEALDYLSDQRFAAALVTSRMARWGRQRLAQELRRRGVAAELAATVLEQTLVEDEASRALIVLCKKQREPLARRSKEEARCQRFLASRGFSNDAIRTALAEHSAALARGQD